MNFAPLLLALAASALPDDWPQWRGPSRDGISAEKGLPEAWSPAGGVLWKTSLPAPSGSTPVVTGDRILLTSPSADGNQALLLCVGTDGKLLWERVVSEGHKNLKNLASASPSTDGRHVWAYFASGDLACFDLEGKELWKADLQKRYGRFKLGFGMTSTPLLHEGRLYVQLIHSGGSQVAALDAATGSEAWKISRPSDGTDECEHAYTSPQVWSPAGKPQLVVHGHDYATGHALADGAELWRLGDLNPRESYNKTLRFVSSPVAATGLLVVPTAKNGQVVALAPTASGRIDRANAAHQAWRIPAGTPDVASPLLHDGLVYLAGNDGSLTCLDAKDGSRVYRERSGAKGHFASPAAGDGKIYLAGRDGTVAVLAAGRTFKVLALNKLGDPLDSSPAISGGRLYLRGSAHLWAVGAR